MRGVIFFLMMNLSMSVFSQDLDWMTSLDIAKKMALTQNKMLFVMWEEAVYDLEAMTFQNDAGQYITVNFQEDDNINAIIWEHFVPVRLNETHYEDLYSEIKGKRKLNYINKFNDDSVKIMDANGNILNTSVVEQDYRHVFLFELIEKYSLNTFYLNKDLRNYAEVKNFITTFRLSSKYMDYAILQNKAIEKELIGLSLVYLEEAKQLLNNPEQENRQAFEQKCEMLRIFQYAITGKPRRVLRELKKLSKERIYDINESWYNYLNYVAYSLLEDEENIALWKSKVSLVDLKKAELIISKNL